MKDLNSIYFAVLQLPAEEQGAYLSQACGGDRELRARVEELLAVAEEAEAFFDGTMPATSLVNRPPERGSSGPIMPDSNGGADEAIGQNIGRYKILELIGEGGCGVVYVAEQTQPVRRRVALKVIKPGMDSKQVIARFEAERQALAMMDHPNIAKVLDADTTELGRPYFVMDLVRGTCITDYCDEASLTTKERLDLFIIVCQAVQHAHQKGVIHRDLKPSNILVTLHDGVPVPKVIDFGIAKATEGRLTEATVYTQLHQFIGTPAYMSPEQAEMSGLDIDTRSDIYSLGVLLYELLAGSTPFDNGELLAAGLDAMRKTIREKQPIRPSTRVRSTTTGQARHGQAKAGPDPTTAARRRSADPTKLQRQLRGDLDWIVMKCLEKDRRRRYETANALAMDIKRHLDTEPVVARPPSRLYEFRKTVSRHKFGFAAATALIIVLTAGILTSTWQAVEATRARNAEAEQRIAAQEAQAAANANLIRAEWLVYASKLMLAQADFENGTGGLARQYLEECDMDLRGWEWHYLWDRIAARQTLVGHRAPLTSAAFSPDSRRIVTGSYDSTARIWDAATGEEVLALVGHTGEVSSVAISPDGLRIVTGSGDRTAKVWDAATGRETLTLTGHSGPVRSVAISPDGLRIVTGSEDHLAKVWDSGTGQELLTLEGHAQWIRSVAFSADGRQIVTSGRDYTARVWDARTGRELRTLEGHPHWVASVAISPDGTRIATGSNDGTAKVWDAETGRELLSLEKHAESVTGVAFSPDGRRLVTSSVDRLTKVWDAATGLELFTLKGHVHWVQSAAFSPDGKLIVTAGHDQTAKVWDAERGQEIPTFRGHGDFVSSIAFSSDSKRMVTGSGDTTVKVWEVVTGSELLTLVGHTGRVFCVAISPDGQRIVSGGDDRTARVWNATTGQELLRLEHAQEVSGVAFSPDGKRIVTGLGVKGKDEPSETRVWDAATGQELLVLPHPGVVWSVAFSPDGQRIVSGGGDRIARVWDAGTGQELLALRGHTHWVTSAAFSIDGRRIVTGSHDRTAKVWDAGTGRELLALVGHTESVRGVAFSPDGERIVTGSDDRTVRVWNGATGKEALALPRQTDFVWSVSFSPDGHHIASGIAGAKATVKLWSAAPIGR